MPRIQVPPTGEVIATGPGVARAPEGSFDSGAKAIGIAGRALVEWSRKKLEEQKREDERIAENARRVAFANAKALLDNRIEDLGDKYAGGVLDGSISAEGAHAAFDKEARKTISESIRDLHPDDAGMLQAEAVARSGRQKQVLGHAVRTYNQKTVLAGLDTAEEQYERLALKDRPTAVKEFSQTLQVTGPDAGLLPDAIVKRTQSFRERTAYNQGAEMVRTARDDMKELDALRGRINSDEFSDLDPVRRGQLEQQILARKQYLSNQQDVAARRAEAAAKLRLREAEYATKAVQSIVDNGGMPDAQTVAQAQKATVGTPYEMALTTLVQQSGERSGFASLAPAEQRATLLALYDKKAREGTNPQLEARIDRFEKIAAESEKQLRADPLVWAAQRRLVDGVRPLQFRSVPELMSQIGERLDKAARVSAITKQPVSPLLKDEAPPLAQLLNVLPVEERAQAVSALGAALQPVPGATQALAAQIGESDRGLMLAMSYGKLQNVAKLILRGQAALKDKGVEEDSTAGFGWRARIATEIGDAYPNEQVRQAAIDSARFILAGLKASGEGEDIRRAVRIATGGLYKQRVPDENGDERVSLVPKPYGWTDEQFEKRRASVIPPDLYGQLPDGKVYTQGQPIDLDQFTRQLPSATLMHAGQGKYAVRAGSGFVTNKAGDPVILDFTQR